MPPELLFVGRGPSPEMVREPHGRQAREWPHLLGGSLPPVSPSSHQPTPYCRVLVCLFIIYTQPASKNALRPLLESCFLAPLCCCRAWAASCACCHYFQADCLARLPGSSGWTDMAPNAAFPIPPVCPGFRMQHLKPRMPSPLLRPFPSPQ